MKIRELNYIVVIIENGFNLSKASDKIHISQPALSKSIKTIEQENDISIFERAKGRLVGLTNAGEILYSYAKKILGLYDDLIKDIREESEVMRGSIEIGIPPLVNSVVFPEVLPELFRSNSNIYFKITELGSQELKKEFLVEEVPIAILLEPTDFHNGSIEEVNIANAEMAAFMSQNNPLATKTILTWKDFENTSISMFTDSFMIYHQVKNKLDQQNLKYKVGFQSSTWDLLLSSTKYSNLITILPTSVSQVAIMDNLQMVPIKKPLYWRVNICRKKKSYYNKIEDYVFKYLVNYFNEHNLT
ncbi:LysR family transcriptional regulator [Amphibacillus sp. Q70]|uniref:LysR family transcriptional regulator n=1 Tax=Amphibacillus sp. Q70 TaxID=3453416 RepID=UPI003F844F27